MKRSTLGVSPMELGYPSRDYIEEGHFSIGIAWDHKSIRNYNLNICDQYMDSLTAFPLLLMLHPHAYLKPS